MNKFVFVILHYYSIQETISCIDSIVNKIDVSDYSIVVVDNGSRNNTGDELVDIYKNNSNIIVLLNKENLGFARGNNAGFEYAKAHLDPAFIVMLNNDTLIMQDDFCQVILTEYNTSRFAVLGPLIICPSGKSSENPGKSYVVRGLKLWNMIIQMAIKYFLAIFYLDFILMAIRGLKHEMKSKTRILDLTNKRVEGVVLHGCCMVFSPEYIARFDGLDSRTFLFMEEEILFLHIKVSGLLSVYNPDLMIYHKEDAATDMIYSKSHEKKLFIFKNSLDSLFIYKNILRENGL
jgi:GT2 family glycosyltransferase